MEISAPTSENGTQHGGLGCESQSRSRQSPRGQRGRQEGRGINSLMAYQGGSGCGSGCRPEKVYMLSLLRGSTCLVTDWNSGMGKSLQLRLRAQIRDNPHLCTSATKRPAEKGGGWLLSGCFSLLSRSYGVNTTDAQGMYVPMRYIRTTYRAGRVEAMPICQPTAGQTRLRKANGCTCGDFTEPSLCHGADLRKGCQSAAGAAMLWHLRFGVHDGPVSQSAGSGESGVGSSLRG